jgi:hypothetical protein
MNFPPIQILTDQKSFDDLFEPQGLKGGWRNFTPEAIYVLTSLLTPKIKKDFLVYECDNNPWKKSGLENFLIQEQLLHSNINKLEYFDRFDTKNVGPIIEFNSHDYKWNMLKSERLKRICCNPFDENQVIDILGVLCFQIVGDIIYDKKNPSKSKTGIFWNQKVLPPVNSLVVANSYIPATSEIELNFTREKLLQLLPNELEKYCNAILPSDIFSGTYELIFLTKNASKKDKEDRFNKIDRLFTDHFISLPRLNAHLQSTLSPKWKAPKVFLSEEWHHRKIFSDYFLIYHDDSIHGKRSTTYTIQGILRAYDSYWTNLEEANRFFNNNLNSFIRHKSLKSAIIESKDA